MPSTKRSVDRARVSGPGGAGGEPLGETPGVPGTDVEIGGGSPVFLSISPSWSAGPHARPWGTPASASVRQRRARGYGSLSR
jgi:hypothetical protein